MICNHLIISIITKSDLPGEAKLMSPGKHRISNALVMRWLRFSCLPGDLLERASVSESLLIQYTLQHSAPSALPGLKIAISSPGSPVRSQTIIQTSSQFHQPIPSSQLVANPISPAIGQSQQSNHQPFPAAHAREGLACVRARRQGGSRGKGGKQRRGARRRAEARKMQENGKFWKKL